MTTLDFKTVAGRWELIRWAYCWGVELPISDPGNAQKDVYDFLFNEDFDRLGAAKPISGSVLIVASTGTFQQQGKGNSPLLSYDHEGVQVSGVAEFGGRLHPAEGNFYLLAEGVSEQGMPKDPNHRKKLRVDDGDTQICDFLHLTNDRLIRKMMVATDWAYGDCVMLEYIPASV